MTRTVLQRVSRQARVVALASALLGWWPAPAGAQGGRVGDVVPLRRALQAALSESRTLEDAEQALEVADQRVREAWGSAWPDVSSNMSYARNLLVQEIFLPAEFLGGPPGELRPIRVGSDNAWQAGVNVSQPLFEYSVFVGVGAAGRFRALAVEQLRGTTQQVVTAARQAYFDALLAEAQLRLTERSIERVRRTLEETRARNRVGIVGDYDVLRLEVEYANVAANLQRARNAVAASHRALLIEMGRSPDDDISLEGRLDEIDPDSLLANTAENLDLLLLAGVPGVTAQNVDELLQTAAHRRTDLRQLRSSVLLEESRVKLQKADLFPRLSLTGNYNFFAQENGSPDFFGENANQRTKTAAVGVRLEFPIFQGFARRARVDQAKATMRQAETRLARAEQEAVNQVRTLFDGVQEALDRARSQRRAVAQGRRGYEIASAEYREGVGSQLQITDADEALRQVEFSYARAVYDYLTARAKLELATGLVPEEPGQFPATWNR